MFFLLPKGPGWRGSIEGPAHPLRGAQSRMRAWPSVHPAVPSFPANSSAAVHQQLAGMHVDPGLVRPAFMPVRPRVVDWLGTKLAWVVGVVNEKVRLTALVHLGARQNARLAVVEHR